MGILGGVFHQSCIHRIAFLLDAPSLRVPCGQRSRARLCETRAAKLIGRTPIYLAFIFFIFISPITPLPLLFIFLLCDSWFFRRAYRLGCFEGRPACDALLHARKLLIKLIFSIDMR